MTDDQQKPAGIYELFMLGLCTYVLTALAAMTFFRLDESVVQILEYVDLAICAAFMLDFLFQLFTAKNKLRYMKLGWLDLLSSIPMVGPMRLARVARFVRILRLLRGVKSAKMLSAYLVERRAGSAITAVAFVALLTIVCSSIAVLQLERSVPNANITTAEDALWWSVVTITTVGYGDHCPVSAGGKLVAILTMTVGVGLFGTFTAFVATWFIEPGEQQKDDELQRMRKTLESIEEKLSALQNHTPDIISAHQRPLTVAAEAMAR